VQVGQLHGVTDRLDLTGQPTDIFVGDIRHLFEHEVLDLGLGHPLEHEPGPGVDGQRVPDPDVLAAQGLGPAAYPLLVGVSDDQDPVVVEDLLDQDDLADLLVALDRDDVQGLVEHDLTAGNHLRFQGGPDRDAHLAARGEDVDDAVGRLLKDQAVGVRRLGQTVDLGLEVDDLAAGVLEGAHEALVLRRQGGHRAGLGGNPVLQLADAGRVGASTAQISDLGLELSNLGRDLCRRLGRGQVCCDLLGAARSVERVHVVVRGGVHGGLLRHDVSCR
jgi:hypothetical protein